MDRNLVSLEQCLFDAFMYPGEYNPQDLRQMWAIEEVYMRNLEPLRSYQMHTANKEHECVKGCKIKSGDVYTKYHFDAGFNRVIKLCASCTAMVFYFIQVWRSEPEMYTHWDADLNKPVLEGVKPKPRPYHGPADSLYQAKKK